MRNKIFIFFILFISVFSFSEPISNYVFTDIDTAKKIASLTDKYLIIMFSSDSCIYCKKFKENVLTDAEISKWLKTEYVFTEINPTSSRKATFGGKQYTYSQLYGGFGVRGTPSFLFMDRNENSFGILPGYLEKENFLQILMYIKYENNNDISLDDFISQNLKVSVSKRIIYLSQDDIDFLMKYDPNTVELKYSKDLYSNVVSADKDFPDNYIVIKKK